MDQMTVVSSAQENLSLDATASASAEKQGVALSSVLAAVVLTGSKLAVGILTGSLGLLSEALHSGLDLVAAAVTYLAVRIADRPADADHRYGHGKVENISALFETMLLFITCFWIVSEAVQRLFFKSVEVEATVWSFVVIVGSIIIDISRSRALMRVAKKHNSQALEADALHFSTDVWSSCVVLVGLVAVKVGEMIGGSDALAKADALAALGVAVIVIGVCWRLGKRTIDVLLDRAPEGVAGAIEATACATPGVMGCERLRVRESGNRTFVDVVVHVDADVTVRQGHDVADEVKRRIEESVPFADVVVHMEPSTVAAGNPDRQGGARG
jgi:cation diffusion facilitator family transporter